MQLCVSVFDSSVGQRRALAFDGGNGMQLLQRWMIEMAFNGGGGGGAQQWRQHLMVCNSICQHLMVMVIDYGKVMVRQRWPA